MLSFALMEFCLMSDLYFLLNFSYILDHIQPHNSCTWSTLQRRDSTCRLARASSTISPLAIHPLCLWQQNTLNTISTHILATLPDQPIAPRLCTLLLLEAQSIPLVDKPYASVDVIVVIGVHHAIASSAID